ncbi:DUF4358 domain-containing protein [Oscillospiraceae bacterium 50-58]
MRKFMYVTLALALLLGLAACKGGRDSEEIWKTSHVQNILDSGAFSEELEELDADTAFMLYRLSDCGLEREQLAETSARRSAGATCEELAVLIFDSTDSATAAKSALEDYVQSQITANEDYRPAEIPKLEKAWIDQRSNSLLLVVANDMDAAKQAVE